VSARRPSRLATTLRCGVLVAALTAASACTTAGSDATDDNGYVSGDGSITVIDPADRKPAPTIQGPKLGGGTLDTSAYADETVVLNIWGSWCGECRGEAVDLAAASKLLRKDGVVFVGLDTRDRDSLAEAYVRRFDIPYPSLVDQDSRLLLDFYGIVSPNAIPSTLVIDSDGKLAAVITGPTTKDTLVDLVGDVQQSTS
jgi:peroxiredoxin